MTRGRRKDRDRNQEEDQEEEKEKGDVAKKGGKSEEQEVSCVSV